MECSCAIDSAPEDSGTVLDMTPSYLIATGYEKCCECGEIIESGKKYLYEEGIPVDEEEDLPREEWEWFTYITCLDCKSIRDQFFDGFFYGMIFHDLELFLDDSGGSTHEKCLANLTPRGREIVCSYIEDVWRKIEEEEQEENSEP